MFAVTYFSPKYFNSYYFGFSASGIIFDTTVSPERGIYMAWIPRWMQPYYSETSTFKELYYLLSLEDNRHLHELVDHKITPEFYGSVSSNRLGFTAHYINNTSYIPKIKLVCSDPVVVTTDIILLDNKGSFFYENTNPCAVWDGFELLLKNITLVSIDVIASGGYLDLTVGLSNYPIIEDSFIAVVNSKGDVQYYDYESLEGSLLWIDNVGGYTIKYNSSAIYTYLLNGTAYITINDEKISISPKYFWNHWDEYAYLFGDKRLSGEDNLSLKVRCQQNSLSKNIKTKISTLLGLSQSYIWDVATENSVNLSGSGIYEVDIIGINPLPTYITENPVKIDSNYILRQIPKSYVTVQVGSKYLTSDSFSVSGNVIIPLLDILINADPNTVKVTYPIEAISKEYTSSQLSLIERANLLEDKLMFVASTGVNITTSTKKVSEWRWNENFGTVEGVASFEQ